MFHQDGLALSPFAQLLGRLKILICPAAIQFTVAMEALLKLVTLMVVVYRLDRLLEADGDDETDNDGRDVDEKVFPRMRGRVRRVYVQHRLDLR